MSSFNPTSGNDESTAVGKGKRWVADLPPELSSLTKDCHEEGPIPPSPLPDGLKPAILTKARLPNIDPASLALHRALYYFRAVTPDYFGQPYEKSFNWDDLVLPEDVEREWYLVGFRSIRKEGSPDKPLYDADLLAHAEAIENGGLIAYWYGVQNKQRGNLATCIWQSREQAVAARTGPYHSIAVALAKDSYESYNLERYRLIKRRGTRSLVVEAIPNEC